MSADVKATKCPRCGHLLDAATAGFDDWARPRPGDLGICIECGEWLRYNRELEPVLAVPSDFAGLSPRSRLEIELTRAAILRRARGGYRR